MNVITVGAAVLVSHRGQVLMGIRAKEPNRGCWVLPGGGTEFRESTRKAAIRECREETGLDVETTGVAGVMEMIDVREHRVIIVYHAYPIAGRMSVWTRDDRDLKDPAWLGVRQLRMLDNISPVVRPILIHNSWLPS